MWTLIKVLFLMGSGFILGQEVMIRAYNPVNLENNSLNYVAKGFFYGCVTGINKYDKNISHHQEHFRYCMAPTMKFYNDTKKMWHDKIWNKTSK